MDANRLYVLPDGYIYSCVAGVWTNSGYLFMPKGEQGEAGAAGTAGVGIQEITVEEVPVIAFFIDSERNEAYEGMTWVEWVASEFNTSGTTCDDTYVYYGGAEMIFMSPSAYPDNRAKPQDEIMEGESYFPINV